MLQMKLHLESSCTLQVYCDYGGQELAQRYEANEDDEDFDLGYKFAFQPCFMYYYLTGNSAECTRRRIRTKQGSSCFFVD